MKLKAIAVVLLFLLEFCVASPTRPNVLRTEDPGWGVLGVQGAKDIATPNLGALARQGVLFTSGFVAATVRSPSRAGLITGRALVPPF